MPVSVRSQDYEGSDDDHKSDYDSQGEGGKRGSGTDSGGSDEEIAGVLSDLPPIAVISHHV